MKADIALETLESKRERENFFFFWRLFTNAGKYNL